MPDLAHVVVLLPALQPVTRFRQALMDQAGKLGHTALLGPRFYTLPQWVNRPTGQQGSLVSNYGKELILYRELCKYPHLYGNANLWTLTRELLDLFDELNLNNSRLPEACEQFTRFLTRAYGTDDSMAQALGREARLVHTLWRAWHEQLQANKLQDATTLYVSELARNCDAAVQSNSPALYLAGFCELTRAELQWLNKQLTQTSVHIIVQADDATGKYESFHPDKAVGDLLSGIDADKLDVTCHSHHQADDYSAYLHAVFNQTGQDLHQRASGFAEKIPRCPAHERMTVFAAGSNEEEAIAIDLQVRRWLIAGKRDIGIVTENRRLARRVRALLERAGVQISDYSGWALSTSSAASMLESWLQCLEEDFAHEPLLDLLKSPFIFSDWEQKDRLGVVYRLENDIILHEQIPAGLNRYRSYARYRQDKLEDTTPVSYESVLDLLDRLDAAAAPLLPMINNKRYSAGSLLEKLLQSLHLLGLDDMLANDIAGVCLNEVIVDMQQAASDHDTPVDWIAFRAWLGQSIEKATFRPFTQTSPVVLTSVEGSQMMGFDALVMCAVEQEYLPGPARVSPFFNNSVRQELGLPSTHHRQHVMYHQFRRLLECAPELLVTYRKQADGEDIIVSPWLAMLQSFQYLAYDTDLNDTQLPALLAHPGTRITLDSNSPLPGPSQQPRPSLTQAAIPDAMSASAHQQLINCPYQYFLEQCLRLKPPEEVRLALEKSDYGSRVHQCLQAFHGDVENLPGPFPHTLTEANRPEAIHLLERISRQVFATDIEDNFEHRGWLRQWLNLVPSYVDWQIRHNATWQVAMVEADLNRNDLVDGLTLKGKLDRIDSNGRDATVLDYKTGAPPKLNDVRAGEAVQLPFYCLLAEACGSNHIVSVEYVELEKAPVKTNNKNLTRDELDLVRDETVKRLNTIMQELREGKPMPAWGDNATCRYCTMEGICRKRLWYETDKKTETI